MTDTPRRRKGAVDADRKALDQIASLLAAPLNCSRAELAAHDHDLIAQISAFVEATGRQ